MFQNNLKIALRNLSRHKGYSAINILGLAVGMACCIIIMMYVADETGHDRYWKNSERIARMALNRIYPDRQTGYAIIPRSYAGSVKKDCPEVEEAVRLADFTGGNTQLIRCGDRIFEEKTALWADSTFFRVFQIPMLAGEPAQALIAPNSVVLPESTAKRFFGDTAALGQTLFLLGGPEPQALTVTGVCTDLPKNVHFRFDLLISTSGNPQWQQPNHISFEAWTYFLLKPNTSFDALEKKLPAIVEKYAAGEVMRQFGMGYDDFTKAGNGWKYFLQPVRDIHLRSNLEREHQPTGSATMVYMFSVIAGFILLMACINFMNLATARSTERAKEVGIRKTLGSERRQISVQFLMEAMLVTSIAAVLALGIVQLLLPVFNNLADKQIRIADFVAPLNVAGLLVFTLLTGLLAGSYPAGVLSGFKPIEVLKGKFTAREKGAWLRNGLVVFQFAISIALIISTIIVMDQLQFISSKQLGFDKEHVVTIENAFVLGPQAAAYKEELTKLPGVSGVGGASVLPGNNDFFGVSFKKPGDRESVTGRGMVTDEQFAQTLRLELVSGRSFDKNHNDSLSLVLNEKAAADLGLADPIGKTLIQPGSFFDPEENDVVFTVIGVVKDFHYQSLHEPIAPLFMMYDQVFQGVTPVLGIRVEPSQLSAFTKSAETLWKKFSAEQPFHYSFLDSDIAEMYANEQRAKRLFTLFAGLAIFIACMGLLGLAAYVVQQRTKEIGIRKVLGATTENIVGMIAKDFLKLVAVALLLASPLAWWVMDGWLNDFHYRIQIGWWMFVLAGALAAAVAFLTVSFQSMKAALSNPVKSLRSE